MQFSPTLSGSETELEVNMTPLIDIVFLLLIFFLVTTQFADQKQLPIELPGASTGADQPKAQILTITVTKDSTYALNGKEIALESLKTEMTTKYKGAAELVVRADTKATHGAVTTVLDLARKAGIKKFGIAVAQSN